jgi:hypothetical protein
MPDRPTLWDGFPLYDSFDPLVSVRCVTPELPGCFHRFFDTSPISPSGRYLGLTRLRDEAHPPGPGDCADIVIVDLATGETGIVSETRGFEAQLGAQVQWGRTDAELYFSDMDCNRWRPVTVRLDPLTGERKELAGPLYMVSPDGSWLASPCLLRTGLTQPGYGVVAPRPCVPLNPTASPDDGLYVTDAKTGECRLVASFAAIVKAVGGELAGHTGGAFYGFHVKWNSQGTRLMFVVRFRPARGTAGTALASHVITMEADGGNIRLALPCDIWARGGHHPNWCPDGDRVLQNLKVDSTMRFVTFPHDGGEPEPLTDRVVGSGHPTLHPDGRHVLTDEYQHGRFAFDDGTVLLRWVDVAAGTEQTLVRINTRPAHCDRVRVLRVDPHPAWDRSYRRVVFNACPDGYRRVFVAEMDSLLAG